MPKIPIMRVDSADPAFDDEIPRADAAVGVSAAAPREERRGSDGGGGGMQSGAGTGRALQWEKVGRFCLLAAVFFTPFLFLPITQSPVDINKTVIIGILVLVSFVSFLACVIEKRKLEYPPSLLALAVAVFLAVSGVSAYASLSSSVSLYGGLRQPDSLFSIIVYSLGFFLSFYFFRANDIPRIGKLALTSVVLLTVTGLFQVFGVFVFPWAFTKTNAFNPVGSAFMGGAFMAAIIAMVATNEARQLKPRERKMLMAAAVLAAAGLIVLNYQFLWLALTAITIVIAGLRFVSREHFRLPLGMVIMALFLALVSSHVPSLGRVPVEVRPNLSATLSVASQVLHGWRIIVGSGPATFAYDFSKYRPAALNATNFWGAAFSQGYNYPATLLATTGILGILAFLFLIFACLRYLPRPLGSHHLTMTLTAVLFLILILFFYPGIFAEFFFIFVGLGLLAAAGERREVSFGNVRRWKMFSFFVFVLVVMVVALAGLYRVGQKYAATVDYGFAVNAFAAGDVDGAVAKLNQTLALDSQTDEYWRTASQALVQQVGRLIQGGAASGTAQTAIAAAQQAIQSAQNAVALNSADSANWLNVASVYEALIPIANGADRFAEDGYRKAWEKDPNNPQIPVNIARVFIASAARLPSDAASQSARQDRYAAAEDMLKKSLDAKPDYAVPRFLLAQLYIREGNIAQAIERVQEIKANDPFNAGLEFQLGLLFYQNNQVDQAQAEFERAVALSDTYSNARYFLGLIYDKKGMKQQALDQFQKISALNPDNAEVKAIIANLQAGRSALQSVAPPAVPPEKRSNVPVPDKTP